MHRRMLILLPGLQPDGWKVRTVDGIRKVLRLKTKAMMLAILKAASTVDPIEVVPRVELDPRLRGAHDHPAATGGLVDACYRAKAGFIRD